MVAIVTHLGGARFTVGLSLVLCAAGGDLRAAGLAALAANTISHLAVQVLKRTVARPRPADADGRPLALIELPDPFSFPSGHSAAAFAVALALASHYPASALVSLPLASVVAWSRVRLRVHYPSDVMAGIALGIGGVLAAQALLG